jgi:hypothetical protein
MMTPLSLLYLETALTTAREHNLALERRYRLTHDLDADGRTPGTLRRTAARLVVTLARAAHALAARLDDSVVVPAEPQLG